MWKKIAVGFSITAFLITGCSNEGTHNGHDMSQMEMGEVELIHVELQVPDQAKANETLTIVAVVTQDGEAVTDADLVEFEWWLEGEEHQKIEVQHTSDGKYEFTQTFDKPGKYTIISHVTVGAMHSMPNKTFEVTP